MIKAYLLGMIEYKLQCTTNTGIYNEYYDKGRALAHKITRGRYDPS